MFGSSARALSILTLTVSAAASVLDLLRSNRTLIVMDSCNSKNNCHECIQTPQCAWCADPKISKKCFRPDIPPEPIDICPEELTINAENQLVLVRNEEISNSRSSSNVTSTSNFSSFSSRGTSYESRGNNEVHIAPQEVILKLRINEPYRIKFNYFKPEVNSLHPIRREVSSSVEMRDNSDRMIRTKYFSKCKTNAFTMETSKCFNVEAGDVIEFFLEIQATSCPTNRADWNQKFIIYPVGVNETLTVDLELTCDCPCERAPLYQIKDERCNRVGNFACGICECDSGYFGDNCECVRNEDVTGLNSCRPNNQTLIDCFGRGTCTCGVCECERRYNEWEIISGQFCECDNFSCDRHRGQICSGNGACVCGSCRCDLGWTGANCGCSESNDSCIDPHTGEICSGHGACACGECLCHDDRYLGRFCDKCPTCPSRCDELKTCVECKLHRSFGNGSTVECASTCNGVEPLPVDVISEDVGNSDVLCLERDESNCTYSFVYRQVSDNLIVEAQRTRQCQAPVTP